MPRIPDSASSNKPQERTPKAIVPSFGDDTPSWKIGHFDMESKWGIQVLGQFSFNYSEDLLAKVLELEDNDLNLAFEQINGKAFCNVNDLWLRIDSLYKGTLSPDLIKTINKSLSAHFFYLKIYPKLKVFEEMTWNKIAQITHGKKNKTNNHFVPIKNLIKDARDRLSELGFSEETEIYSLRLEGTIRIYGFRRKNYLDIIWIDPIHEIYPTGDN